MKKSILVLMAFKLLLLLPILTKGQCNTLQDITQQLKVHFMGWGCDCPSWCKVSDLDKMNNDTLIALNEHIDQYCFNIEADTITNQIDFKAYSGFDPEKDLIITGSLYKDLQD